jgi:hypothetical protein
MRRELTLTLIALLVLICTGVVHALWTDRWGPPSGRDEAAARMARLPVRLGDWNGEWVESDPEKFPQEVYGVGVEGRFVNSASGNVVTLYLSVGRPGPLTVHTPDLCYGGGGFVRVGSEGRYATGEAEFTHAVFSKADGPVPQHVRALWSWNAGDGWKAHKSPRLALARYRLIYKLYALRTILSPSEPLDEDPLVGFLDLLLPELDRTLRGES